MSATIYIGGTVNSDNTVYIYYRVKDESGAAIEISNNCRILSGYQAGDKFAHQSIILDDLPKGSLKIELYAE